ncbi:MULTISPECIES: glucose-6-phosphate dehydrogenase assembly protein OpcA [Streptomyces]|uniref:Glucose-6-phosphate dehydrogenase subunit n=3 Tax=Streptomyces fradiae TaxID=1906 RepID=A0A1Y2NXY5_STRFR|nr:MULTISPECIES: glucose-6-phosphate dehydrogenase assembly protein OpcA [Streptomyces]KAF0651297.1 oxppcycle protein [Streptomyces fradiae ATCC 10745 = DSM 40063]OSY51788.1 Glucose-6-phosphate dehydrogenase subunit [Streptomyces fradiae ATCC 10745 = DSM 40063]QEV11709.1 glucose-6-phosphate dehydrogenase assembly protein OpcA [Streptomyces fradiae ATCC 10745 = DSM 40063]
MKIDLTDTTSSKINKSLVLGRRAIGTPAVGMVLTLVIVTDEENAYDALKAANEASREHPSRKLVVIKRVSRSPRDRAKARLDAEVRVGADAGTGETVILRLRGEVIDHAQSVVLPLLLPDAPVVVWWPVNAPTDPAADPLGALAQRRVTDTYNAEHPIRELADRAEAYTPGDTDLAWTRITPWRSMLAAALDQVACQVISAEVEGEEFNPSVELLAMWLAGRLGVTVRRTASIGPGLTAVRLETDCGPIVLDRPDGSLATLCVQGQPDRAVALKRRETAELIAEELRRLDPDDTYAAALRYGVERLVEGGPASDAGGSGAGAGSGADSGAGSRADSGAPDPGAADSGAPDSGAPDSGDAGTGAADSAADGGSGAGAAPAAKSGGKKAPAKKAAAK